MSVVFIILYSCLNELILIDIIFNTLDYIMYIFTVPIRVGPVTSRPCMPGLPNMWQSGNRFWFGLVRHLVRA